MIRKRQILLSGLILLTAATVTYAGIVKPTSSINTTMRQNEKVEKNEIKIAFVNEDTGTSYHDQPMNMGNILVDSFDKQTDYPIEVVTRSIAERGLGNGNYQLMVVLPSKFSSDSLALESVSPNQAVFQYQIKSDKPLVTRKAEQAVSDLQMQFNKDLISIYFSSIIGNLHTAQGYMAEVVSNENSSLTAYRNNLLTPLTGYSGSFSGITSFPNSFLSTYSSFTQALNNSNDSFTSIANVNKTYDSELGLIKGTQETWQKSIDERERNLATYDTEFSKLTVSEQLQQLRTIKSALDGGISNPASWDQTIKQAQELNEEIDKLIDVLKGFNASVDETFNNYEGKIEEAITSSLSQTSGLVDNTETLGLFVQVLNHKMLDKINHNLKSLKMMDDASIDSLSLSENDKQYLKNINRFVDWYATENSQTKPAPTTSKYLERVETVKSSVIAALAKGGTLSFDGMEGAVSEVVVAVPSNYSLSIDGYTVNQISNTTYQVQGLSGNLSNIALTYHLSPIDSSQVDILTTTSIKASATTVETIDIAVKKEKEEIVASSSAPSTSTSSSIDPTTSISPSTGSATSADDTMTSVPTTKVVTVYEPEAKELKRTYTAFDALSPYSQFQGVTEGEAIFQDIYQYLSFSGIVQSIYDIDLATQSGDFKAGDEALLNATDVEALKKIIINLIKESTINSLKESLHFPDEKLAEIDSKKAQATELEKTINDLKTNTNDLVTQLEQLLTETEKIDETIKSKPILVTTDKFENTDMVTVTTSMNADLISLMNASRTLMENTKSNQSVAESITQSLTQLKNDVASLEADGTSLSNRVNELNTIMSTEYQDNTSFLQAFSGVLGNTKVGNEKNQAVYNYLSNPVNADNINAVVNASGAEKVSVVASRDDRSPLVLILISFVISLGLAYSLQHTKWGVSKQAQERVSWKNALVPMGILSGIATVSALLIYSIAGMKLVLSSEQMILLVIVGIFLLLTFTYANNLLLRRVSHLGFLVSIAMLLLYIISASQLFDVQHATTNQGLSLISPLSYAENLVQAVLGNQSGWLLLFFLLLLLTPMLGFFNAMTYRKIED